MEILRILKVGGPLSAADIATEFGASVSAVRPHLERLAADELVTIEIVRGGRGRPRYRYKLTESAEHEFPNDYESLAVDLFDAAAQIGGDDMLDKLFGVREKSLFSLLKPQVTAKTLEGKLTQIGELLNELGYMSSVERDGDDFVLYARHCPVPAISDHSSVPLPMREERDRAAAGGRRHRRGDWIRREPAMQIQGSCCKRKSYSSKAAKSPGARFGGRVALTTLMT